MVIAIANDQMVWLLDGDRWRKIVSLEPSHWRVIVLAIAIPLQLAGCGSGCEFADSDCRHRVKRFESPVHR